MAGPQKFWMVFNSSARGPKQRHNSEQKAREEADRLAAQHPGAKCYVLEAIGYATTGDKQKGGETGPVERFDL